MPRWPLLIFSPPRFTATGTTPSGHDSPQTDAVVRAQALSSFSENITYAGPTGAGHRMKLLHNYVSLGSVALLPEPAACARRAGLDPEIFVDVLAKGGGAGAALNRLGRVDGFDDDEAQSECDEGCKVLVRFLATERNALEALELADQLLDTGAGSIECLREERWPVLGR